MPRAEELEALRLRTALQVASPVTWLRLSGPDAYRAADWLCPAELTLQDAQLRPTLLLEPEGQVFADATVGRDDEDYLLMTEGPDAAAVEAWVRRHLPEGAAVTVTRLDLGHRALALHGPWSWELLGATLGPDVLGMPYLSLVRVGQVLVARNGKTGEHGYDLLVPEAEAAQVLASLREHGRAFHLAEVSQESVDQCSLENGFFNARREGARRLDPFELGLQWRLSRRKEAVGTRALAGRREVGPARRVACLLTEGAPAVGEAITHEGELVGEVLVAGASPLLGQTVVLALLRREWAWPGIAAFSVGGASARTVSAPVVDNRSLHVNPQRHTYREVAALQFPPLTR
jgi:glycine cleavage system aminomethyltransferase T